MQFLYPSPPPEPVYAPITDAEWEALYVEYDIRGSGPREITENSEPNPVQRRRRSSPELREILRQSQEISFEENRLMDEMADRALRRARPRTPEPKDESRIPGPSRVRSPSSDPDEVPRPKKPCMGSLPYRKRFRGL